MTNERNSRDWLDKLEVLAKVAIPIVLAIYGTSINSTLKEKEIKLKYVEVAVGILKSEPTSESQALRDWSIKIINSYSPIPLDPKAINELQKYSLPNSAYMLDESGDFILDESGNRIEEE